LAVSVVEPPEQIGETDTAAVTVAELLIVIVRVAVLVQPFALVPVTVYVVVEVGLTVIEVPVRLPGCHVYDTPPEAVIVTGLPEQTVVAEAVVVIVGLGNTVTVILVEEVQPVEEFVPLTV
jgi:hypothetical protein